MDSNNEAVTWIERQFKLSDLTPWPINPRQIDEVQAERLNKSLADFGQVETIAVGPDNEVYNGHQRLKVWMEQHGPDYQVDCRVSSRSLSEQERKRLTVLLHEGAVGSWDFDLLAKNFNVDNLLEWGFDEDDLSELDYTDPELSEKSEVIRQREMLRVLVSVPIDVAIDVKAKLDELAETPGIEIDYGAN